MIIVGIFMDSDGKLPSYMKKIDYVTRPERYTCNIFNNN